MAVRITGLNSGLDTDSIVHELVSAYSLKKENIVKKQTKTQWTQDAWKDLNKKIYDFYTSLDAFRFNSGYNVKSTSVSDSSKASVSASSKSVVGSQTLQILETAATGYLTGSEVGKGIKANSTLSELGITEESSISVEVGGKTQTLKLTPDMKVADFTSKLKKMGVEASFDEATHRFFISSTESGKDFDFNLTGSDGVLDKLGLNANAADENKKAIKIDGRDAEIILNGAKFKSNTNSFSINGLTIDAKEKTDGAITITTNVDTKGIYDKIKGFLKSYNELISEMDKLYSADSSKGYEPLTDDEKEEMSEKEIEKWETKIKDSLLRRDPTLNSITTSMKSAMAQAFKIDGKTFSLASFGIKTQSYSLAASNEKGSYHIDGDSEDSVSGTSEDKLMQALSENPNGVAEFFTQLTSGLYKSLDSRMKSTSLSSAYTVYNDKQLQKDYDNYKQEISSWEDKLKYYEDFYYDKFSAMESALAKLQSSQNSLAQLLGG